MCPLPRLWVCAFFSKDQRVELITPAYKLIKEGKTDKDSSSLVNLSSVSVPGSVEAKIPDQAKTHKEKKSTPSKSSSFTKKISALNDKWSETLTCFEALLMMKPDQPTSALSWWLKLTHWQLVQLVTRLAIPATDHTNTDQAPV